jgi:hypothetical protein
MYAGDLTGRYQIGTASKDARQKILAARWVDGTPTVFEVPGSGVFNDPTDVTSTGVVVGTASGVQDDEGFAWRYRDGKVTKLRNPLAYHASGKDVINERGDIAAAARGAADMSSWCGRPPRPTCPACSPPRTGPRCPTWQTTGPWSASSARLTPARTSSAPRTSGHPTAPAARLPYRPHGTTVR